MRAFSLSSSCQSFEGFSGGGGSARAGSPSCRGSLPVPGFVVTFSSSFFGTIGLSTKFHHKGLRGGALVLRGVGGEKPNPKNASQEPRSRTLSRTSGFSGHKLSAHNRRPTRFRSRFHETLETQKTLGGEKTRFFFIGVIVTLCSGWRTKLGCSDSRQSDDVLRPR